MDRIYTELNLLRYHYAETDLFETLEIEHALEEDRSLKNSYREMIETLKLLPPKRLSPSQKSLNRILDYSRLPA